MGTKLNKGITTALKLIISVVLIYFIYTKIDVQEIKEVLQKSNPFYLVLALALFLVSKIIASFRLNGYFHQLNVLLAQKTNLQLYFLGMFYNLFLPGGIGGDAYKGYLIKKEFDVTTKKVVGSLILDRLSGLLLLFIYSCVLIIALNNENISTYNFLIVLAIPVSVIAFWLLNKFFFGYVLSFFWKSFLYSALVQLAQLACVWLILHALGIHDGPTAYLVIFLVSSIIAVLPLTIGGIGSREVTFFYGASLLGLDENISIGISVVFFLITALVSLTGIYYHFKGVRLTTEYN